MRGQMAKIKIVTAEDKEIYDAVVFQAGRVLSGPNGMGFLEVETVTKSYTVVITADDAAQLIIELQDFVKGRAPHFARDDN